MNFEEAKKQMEKGRVVAQKHWFRGTWLAMDKHGYFNQDGDTQCYYEGSDGWIVLPYVVVDRKETEEE